MNTEIYNPKKDIIVIRFVEELKRALSLQLKNIVLYGSRARGDFNKNSDYDFLIILTQKNKDLSERVYDVGYFILDSYEALASCMIWDEIEWERKKGFSLAKKIIKDGIVLL